MWLVGRERPGQALVRGGLFAVGRAELSPRCIIGRKGWGRRGKPEGPLRAAGTGLSPEGARNSAA